MKVLSMIVASLVVGSSQAATILNCNTIGDALGGVQIVENSKGKAMIQIIHMDSTQTSYELMSSLKNLKKGSSDTLIAAKDLSHVFGGSIQDAVLMRVSLGQKRAILSMDSYVYILNCSR